MMRIKMFDLNDDGTVTDIETGEVSDAVPPNGRLKVAIKDAGVSLTHQSFADKCDVNKIIASYEATGIFPTDDGTAVYDDVTHLQGDLTTMIEQSRQTNEAIADAKLKAAANAAAQTNVEPNQGSTTTSA